VGILKGKTRKRCLFVVLFCFFFFFFFVRIRSDTFMMIMLKVPHCLGIKEIGYL
jgi:hypothetical protein